MSVPDQCNCCGTAKSTDRRLCSIIKSVVSVPDQCNCCGTAKLTDRRLCCVRT